MKDSFESVNLLLATLGDIKAFDLDLYFENSTETTDNSAPESKIEETHSNFFDDVDEVELNYQSTSTVVHEPEMVSPVVEPAPTVKATPTFSPGAQLNASKLKAHFASESYRGMKGIIGELSESLALNQRFMFTKELFDGNADLLRHALKSIDEAGSFGAAVELINSRYVSELNWETDSEAVREFLQLVYRKYAD